jgi:hypothetical protein
MQCKCSSERGSLAPAKGEEKKRGGGGGAAATHSKPTDR